MTADALNRNSPVSAPVPDGASASQRLAFEDYDFLRQDDLRGVRLQLEFLKPERRLRQEGVASTIVVFGSARLLPEEIARAECAGLEERVRQAPGDSLLVAELGRARRRLHYARYYAEARHFAELVSTRFQREGRLDFVVCTGGGPGIMEAANRGAHETGLRSIGFNIQLPHEQQANEYLSADISFRFHYFALRKMHFMLRALALVAFPGGYGTLDELFEVLTLVQTGKAKPLPIVLVGAQFWRRAIDFEFLEAEGMISADDRKLFAIVDTADAAVAAVCDFYDGKPPEQQR
ncbi:MAG: TIGR00730 family Rossman fold protein [Caulobacterales bacterium]|jgi:uncharacterized protein (TIGR00730 family)|nr:TIGR00730 family Rossman fold protein [Caulobacterales bacterium]